jgi:glycosyltransferase involved in cell wall biosynthesis
MNLSSLATLGSDVVRNLYEQQQLAYVVETANWSVKWDGRYITRALRQQRLLTARTTTIPLGIQRGIVHFGSFRTVYFRKHRHALSPRCRKVLTVWHIPPGNPQYAILSNLQHELAAIHTSCATTKNDLVALGVDEAKITVIPLGVDTSLFQPARPGEQQALRQRFGVPPDAFVVGSFQKDGQGWAAGDQPKLEKGPDILVQALAQAARQMPVHVLLAGPARGYVVKGLQKHAIPYTHLGYVADYRQLAQLYRLIDAYVISSRVEGGPKALLESWASGIPVVTTRMGMAADLAENGREALVYDVADAAGLADGVARIMTDPMMRERIIKQAQQKASLLDWQAIARRYYDQIYAQLL